MKTKGMTEREFREALKGVFVLAEAMCGSLPPDDIDDMRREVRSVRNEVNRRLAELRRWQED